ncbi:hypothetical protein [Chitinophaga sp. MM2321]|uniref:hypothetical protein n=1 Tax=Chitinophaga sp. MM2321 TaxID=3137178 RepID=UPI0032D5ACE4
MTIDKNYIPVLRDSCSYTQFSSNMYTLCIDGEAPTKLQINSITKSLLDLVNGTNNLEQIAINFNKSQNKNFSVDDIVHVFNKQILGYGIFATDNVEKIKVKDEYLRLRFTLVPAFIVRKITPLFIPLFQRQVFLVLLTASILLLAGSFLTHVNVSQVYHHAGKELLLYFLIINYISLLLHEFGHAAACDTYGATSGDIGFGFYLVAPVFFSDVTDTWRLQKNQRLVVDFGGIYLQLIVCSALAICFYITGNRLWLDVSFLIAVTLLVNINPFLRYDGYWILSDLLSISNLKEKSMHTVGRFFGRMSGINKTWKPDKRALFLLTYGLLSIGITIAFVIYMLLFNGNSILYFPVRLYAFVRQLLLETGTITFDWLKDSLSALFIPALFYIILIRQIIVQTKKRYRRYSNEKIKKTEPSRLSLEN